MANPNTSNNKKEGMPISGPLNFLSAVVFITEFEAVFLHQLGCVAGKSEYVSIDIEVFA